MLLKGSALYRFMLAKYHCKINRFTTDASKFTTDVGRNFNGFADSPVKDIVKMDFINMIKTWRSVIFS